MRRTALASLAALLTLVGMLVLRGSAGAQDAGCASSATGRDFHGTTLTSVNFAHQNLRNANFRCATFAGVNFTRADLTGADFSNAVFSTQAGSPAVVDFNFADLTNAKFVGARFDAPTYFTYAMLTSADFSQTDLAGGNAIFGDQPLRFAVGDAIPRPAFRGAAMNCEFVAQWPALDLTNARIAKCLPEFAAGPPRDFSGAMLSGVDLSGAVLDRWTFADALLNGAILNRASLQGADLHDAQLQGAQLNNANLSGATLDHAVLSNDDDKKITDAAALKGAQLRNVNLSNAKLSGVDFSYANLYSGVANLPCKVDAQRFTAGCATVHGATLTATLFDQAYLYGLDLSDVQATGASFRGAMLADADFSGAKLDSNPITGTNTSFLRAYLQGTNLRAARLNCSGVNCYDLTDAFVDFTPGGNNLYVQLSGVNHNSFAGCPTTLDPATGKPVCREDVCVYVNSKGPTALPSNTASFTCPNHDVGPCGATLADGSNARWASQLDPNAPGTNSGVPPGWYEADATYTKASKPQDVCNGRGTAARVLSW